MYFEREIITSRNNQFVKWVSGLSDKKNRKESGYFLAEGLKLTREAFEAGLPVEYCIVSEGKKDVNIKALGDAYDSDKYQNCKLITVAENVFEKISTEKGAQGIISVIKHLDFFKNMDIIYKEDFFIQEGERALSLYSLRDPGNLGAVIRSAVAFGVQHIILSADSADIYNPKTVRAAMGTMFGVKISYVSDFASFIGAAKANGRAVYAAELSDGARSLREIALSKNDIFIIGNEGHGIPAEISSECTCSVYIPISEGVESLNASVAASVFMWEQNNL